MNRRLVPSSARFLETIPDFELVAQADSVDAAVSAIAEHRPDILYLDIQLGRPQRL